MLSYLKMIDLVAEPALSDIMSPVFSLFLNSPRYLVWMHVLSSCCSNNTWESVPGRRRTKCHTGSCSDTKVHLEKKEILKKLRQSDAKKTLNAQLSIIVINKLFGILWLLLAILGQMQYSLIWSVRFHWSLQLLLNKLRVNWHQNLIFDWLSC